MSSQKRDKAMMATQSDSEDEDFVCSYKSSEDEEKVVAFVASVKEASTSDKDDTLNDSEDVMHHDAFDMYESLFDETCVLRLENMKLIKKVFELQEEVESLHLVRTKVNEKVTFLEIQLHKLNEMATTYIGEDEIDDLIASLEAQVQ